MSYILISHPVQTEDTRQSLRGKKKKRKKVKAPKLKAKLCLAQISIFYIVITLCKLSFPNRNIP